MDLNQAQDCVFKHFSDNGFAVEELPFLASSLEWRPHALATRTRRGVQSKAALVVRENFSSIKEPHLWEPLIETRRQLPDLAIYFAVPEKQVLQPLQAELYELGIGLYTIRPDGQLFRVATDRVPFDDVLMTYAIEPGKPYRNRQNLFKVLAHSEDFVWWLDKHFTAAGIGYLYDFFTNDPNLGNVTQIRILGSALVRPPEIALLRIQVAELQTELAPKGITLEMRLMDEPTYRPIHDRYIISRRTAFNVLPTRSIATGQVGSLVLDDNPPDFNAIWNASAPL